jgi:putative phosphoesterase
MRLAILSDIHGNIPALEAALDQIDRAGVDGIISAGDMVGGPEPGKVIERLLERKCRMIRGNNEEYILKLASPSSPEWWHTSKQFAFIRWNHEQLNEETIAVLKSLPEQLVVTEPGEEDIRVVHGSPRSSSELVYPEKDIAQLDLALEMVPEKNLVFGHTHIPWKMRRNGKLAFTPGSVSATLNGKLGGSYAILNSSDDGWRVELIELHYDTALTRKAFISSGLLAAGGKVAECWLHDLETGVNTLPRFVEYAYQLSTNEGNGDLPYVPDEIWERASQTFSNRI